MPVADVTDLSVLGVPGGPQSFEAKDPADGSAATATVSTTTTASNVRYAGGLQPEDGEQQTFRYWARTGWGASLRIGGQARTRAVPALPSVQVFVATPGQLQVSGSAQSVSRANVPVPYTLHASSRWFFGGMARAVYAYNYPDAYNTYVARPEALIMDGHGVTRCEDYFADVLEPEDAEVLLLI